LGGWFLLIRQGAFPLITIGSDRVTRRMYTEVPVKYDSQIPELSLKLLSFITAVINVDHSETVGLLYLFIQELPPGYLIIKSKTLNNIQIVPVP
jgi:hypothetical protein